MASNNLFRKVALEKLSSPEQLDQLMKVTSSHMWLALLGVGILLGAAVIWGFTGTIPTTINAGGILLRGDGIQTAAAPIDGQITAMQVKAGDSVEQNAVIATITALDGSKSVDVRSPVKGKVLELRVKRGNYVSVATPLMSFEPIDEPLQAVLYLPADEAKSIQPGMQVQLSPSTVRSEEYGVLMGTVSSVGSFPLTSEAMLNVLGNQELVQKFGASGAPIDIHVTLNENSNTPSGYQWSSVTGPHITLQTGTFCSATVILEQKHPISMIFGE